MRSLKSRQNLRKVSYTREEVETFKKQYREYIQYRKSGWEKLPYNEFLDIVTQRLDPTLNEKTPICPFCRSTKVTNSGGMSTLVGSCNPAYDPNHHWANCSCNDCGQTWTMEYAGIWPEEGQTEPKYNVWLTKDSRILAGLPTCFEAYIHTCSKCGGDVHRHYRDKQTGGDCGHFLHYKDGKPTFNVFYRCDKCGVEVKCSNDYYYESSPHAPHKPHKKIRWWIKEEVGIAVINDAVISQIEIPGDEDA